MATEDEHQLILAASRIADQVADEFLGGEPDWDPLHNVLPMEWCDAGSWLPLSVHQASPSNERPRYV